MGDQFIMTVVGPDEPGVMNSLAEITHRHEGKWLASKISNLEGQFAAVIKVEAPAAQTQRLKEALIALPRLQLAIHDCRPAQSTATRSVSLTIDSEDYPGLVNEVAALLHSHGINVNHMTSHRLSVAETGSTVFTAELDMSVPAELDPAQVAMELECLHKRMVVQILS